MQGSAGLGGRVVGLGGWGWLGSLGCWLVAAVGLGALGCGEGGERVRPGGCGLAGYDWLPAAEVGAVLDFAEHDELALSSAALDALLAAEGYAEFTPLPYGGRLFSLRYSTQDKGRTVEATGLVALPWNAGQPAAAHPRVLFLHGTTGFTSACAPSRRPGEDGLALLLLAAHGWIAVAPDYIGLDAGADPQAPPPVAHAYLGLEQTAIGSLDMLRAADALLRDELAELARPGPAAVLWGGSQGGHAVFACDRLAPLYAPEFDIVAALALVPATDLVGLAEYALSDTNPATAALAASLASLHRWHQGQAPLDALLTDEAPAELASALLPAMDGSCRPDAVLAGIESVDQVYQPEILEAAAGGNLAALEPWGCYMRHNSIATTPFPLRNATPTLFVLGERDDLVDAASERADFDRLCAAGYRLDYLECAGAGHTEAAAWSLPEQIAWLQARLEGRPLDPAAVCRRRPPSRCSLQPD